LALAGIDPVDALDCVHSTPVLVHLKNGAIFSSCGGTMTFALRVPEPARSEATGSGAETVREYPAYPQLGIAASRLDLVTIGPIGLGGSTRPRTCAARPDHAGRRRRGTVGNGSRFPDPGRPSAALGR
jgi:hypothetical protein